MNQLLKDFIYGVLLGIFLGATLVLVGCPSTPVSAQQRRTEAPNPRPFNVYPYNDVCVFIAGTLPNSIEMRILPRNVVGGDCLP